MINKNIKNNTIIVMGGGTSGWVSALYLLNKNLSLDLNLKIKLISSKSIEPIGVGEGCTPLFSSFIENICRIDREEFLRETKGSLKYGIKFENWNFDQEYYYHLFSSYKLNSEENKDLDYKFSQFLINENFNISTEKIQKKVHGLSFDLLDNKKITIKANMIYAYHFSANLLIPFLKTKCSEFENFEHIEGDIENFNYNEDGSIQSANLNLPIKVNGDFFINCLGFKSTHILNEEYFDIKNWDNYILNNSAFAIQVKNSANEIIDPYTTSTAQEYGWSWKIPQYEKTGYGYVFSDQFTNDEEKLYDKLLKTYSIKEQDVFKTKIVKSKPYFNKKQLHKNCLSLGLSSGFIEPLEATSIHMTLIGLDTFSEMLESKSELTQKNQNIFNHILEKNWENVFKFIIFHYFTNNPINDYWNHYKNIQENKIFDFYEQYYEKNYVFSKKSYFQVSLGLKIKNYCYSFSEINFFKQNFDNYLSETSTINLDLFPFHNKFLNKINMKF